MTSDNNDSGDDGPFSVKDNDDSTRLARLALLFDQPQSTPIGDKPDTDELWDWMHGAVAEERSRQIQSHLARDAEVYDQWHEMRLAEQEFNPAIENSSVQSLASENVHEVALSPADNNSINEDQALKSNTTTQQAARRFAGSATAVQDWREKLTSWLKPSPYGGGLVLAAILGGVVAININQTQPVDVWEDWQSPKSFDDEQSLSDIEEISSVLAGIGYRLNELSLPVLGPDGQELPGSIPQCQSGSDACSERRQALFDLGTVAIRARVVCLTSLEMPAALIAEVNEIRQLLEGDEAAGRFTGAATTLADSDRRRVQCASANQIIAQALKGLGS